MDIFANISDGVFFVCYKFIIIAGVIELVMLFNILTLFIIGSNFVNTFKVLALIDFQFD